MAVGVCEGEVIDGKYRIEALLGAGGMGAVYAARHLQLDERVAIKLLLPELVVQDALVERFAREAKAAVKIKSEHVARVMDVGTLASGCPYMVMEYLDGADLRTWLQEGQPFPIDLAVDLVIQACEAISEAHKLGIVHRDLKPENLFCVERSDGSLCIKVLDFGISKIRTYQDNPANAALTRTVGLTGTPHYASPEQIVSSRDVDERTDIWSLGIILFELLTRRQPFVGTGMVGVMANIAGMPAPSVRTFRPEVPETLERVIARCLEKNREMRYSSIAELVAELRPFALTHSTPNGKRVTGRVRSPVSPPTTTERAAPSIVRATHPREASGTSPKPKLVPIVILFSLLTVALGVVALKVVASSRTQQDATPAPSVRGEASATALISPARSSTGVSPVGDPSPTAPVTSSNAPSPAQAPATPAPRKTAKAPPKVAAGSSAATNLAVATPQQTKPATNSNCDPPYSLDGLGRKHFKPECFSR